MVVTAVYAALLGLLVVALSVNIALYRLRHRIGLGDGGDRTLLRLIRAHGNAVEYVPLALVLLGLLEACGARPGLVHAAGAGLLLARLAHAWGVMRSAGASPARALGAGLTFLLLAAMAVALLLIALPRVLA